MLRSDTLGIKAGAPGLAALLLAAVALGWGLADAAAGTVAHQSATNVAGLWELSAGDFLDGCDLQLRGAVTLSDPQRGLAVVQDDTGAVALRFPPGTRAPGAGQLVVLEASGCVPGFARFPAFPFQPSGSEICGAFEGPTDSGHYYLARLRGWLRAPVSGRYMFWIASDNSSELWLSADERPSKIRRIASVPRSNWVEPREWTRMPSQQSEAIELKAGQSYYIEALHEQSSGSDNLSVAWMGPGLGPSVIDGRYLTPWSEEAGAQTNSGILREYWTNFSLGNLAGISGPRAFATVLAVQEMHFTVLGPTRPPEPIAAALSQNWKPEDNYRWARLQALVKFVGMDGDSALIELSDGQNLAQARVQGWRPEMSGRVANALVQVEGACEGARDSKGALVPGILWAPTADSITVIDSSPTNSALWTLQQTAQTDPERDSTIEGFFATRGVVTFNDQVLGTNLVFLQEGNAALRVTLNEGRFKDQFRLGHSVEASGGLERGRNIGVITPVNVSDNGLHSMPSAFELPLNPSAPGTREGRWSEVQGVIHSANSNGTVTLFDNNGSISLWIGGVAPGELSRWVDAKVRARGVLTVELLDAPVLLVPNGGYVETQELPPSDPFDAPLQTVAGALAAEMDLGRTHRVRISGEVTWRSGDSFYIQDATGGMLARTSGEAAPKIGQRVRIVAFPMPGASGRALVGALSRPEASTNRALAAELDLSKGLSTNQLGTLVSVDATLLSCKTNGPGQTFELQQEDRAFVATLAPGNGRLAPPPPGSQLRVTGVCALDPAGPTLNILLRAPADVVVLSRPPWWTWRKTAVLIGALLAVAAGALLWVHLLRRRLDRQQNAQLVFSRQMLERVEEERRRIAANLHDSLGQVLLAIKNHAVLAMQQSPANEGVKDRLKDISSITSQAIDEVRHITHGLRPYQLDRLGLTQAIRATVNRVENGAISFAVRVEDIDGLFDKESEIHVYRVVQEAVNNIVKHSAATEATVVIKKRDHAVTLSIRDNGRGFDQSKTSAGAHDVGYGLSGMAERVRILRGVLTVDSQPGQGASLNIEIPLKLH